MDCVPVNSSHMVIFLPELSFNMKSKCYCTSSMHNLRRLNLNNKVISVLFSSNWLVLLYPALQHKEEEEEEEEEDHLRNLTY